MAVRALKARVENGRIVIDEPTDLPEGTVLDVVVAEPDDELSAEWRAEIADRIESLRAGEAELIPWDEVEARARGALPKR